MPVMHINVCQLCLQILQACIQCNSYLRFLNLSYAFQGVMHTSLSSYYLEQCMQQHVMSFEAWWSSQMSEF